MGPFWGKSSFGNFWSWRRNLDKYDGYQVGPRQQEIERLWDLPGHLNVLVYQEADRTKALLYSKIPSPNTGSLGGYIRTYYRINEGWRLTKDNWDTTTDIDIFVDRVTLGAWVGGGASTAVLALFLNTMFRNRRANQGLVRTGDPRTAHQSAQP